MTAADTPRRSTATAEQTIAAPFVRALLELAVAKGADRIELIERAGIDLGALRGRGMGG